MRILIVTLLCVGFAFQAEAKQDLSGTYLGVSKYGFFHKGPNWPATRIYLDKVPGQADSYNAVLIEYTSLSVFSKMPWQYLAAQYVPWVNKIIGHLKEITTKVSVHRVSPTAIPGTYNIRGLVVSRGGIESDGITSMRLVLSSDKDLKNPLEGAEIKIMSKAKHHPKTIYFPKAKRKAEQRTFNLTKDERRELQRKKVNHGSQYRNAKFAYEKVGLDSTWRKDFLPGPYLATYSNRPDMVLNLNKTKNGIERASFVLYDKANNLDSIREKQFTNKKSAFLLGEFESIEAQDGMFLFFPRFLQSKNGSKALKDIEKENNLASLTEVEGRIGLFVDIFDATKKGNDVVELILVNPEDPSDFLMYYEHPENGEGE